MTPHATPALAQQLRSLAASAPTLHRPALAAAADAAEELSKLRAEREVAIAACTAEHPEVAQLKAERDFWIARASSAVLDSDRLRAECDEARALLQRARECEGLDFWTDDDASSLREDIDAALKDAK